MGDVKAAVYVFLFAFTTGWVTCQHLYGEFYEPAVVGVRRLALIKQLTDLSTTKLNKIFNDC